MTKKLFLLGVLSLLFLGAQAQIRTKTEIEKIPAVIKHGGVVETVYLTRTKTQQPAKSKEKPANNAKAMLNYISSTESYSCGFENDSEIINDWWLDNMMYCLYSGYDTEETFPNCPYASYKWGTSTNSWLCSSGIISKTFEGEQCMSIIGNISDQEYADELYTPYFQFMQKANDYVLSFSYKMLTPYEAMDLNAYLYQDGEDNYANGWGIPFFDLGWIEIELPLYAIWDDDIWADEIYSFGFWVGSTDPQSIGVLIDNVRVRKGEMPYQYGNLTLVANPSQGGTVSGGGNGIVAGEQVNLVATPNPGYTFSHWSLCGSPYSDQLIDEYDEDEDFQYTVTIGNTTLTAIFIESSTPPPSCATLVSPASGATVSTTTTTLSWNTVTGATSYDVYFGMNSLPSTTVTNTPGITYNASTATPGTYYWKIVPKNTAGEAIGCDTWNFTVTSSCVEVTSITNVPNVSTAGSSISLTGTVNPGNATNTSIVWSVSNDGGTGATFSGTTLNTPNAGTVIVTATISNGSCGSDYSYPFTITVNPSGSCVSVTSITNVPNVSTAGSSISLTGTVNPGNATNTSIIWNVSNDGGTGATLTGTTLNTPNAGTVTVTATISNGSCGSDYTYPFTITVNPLGSCVSVTSITNVPNVSTAGSSISLTGTVNPGNATNTGITWNLTNAGGTGATLTGTTLNTPNAGTVTVTATISNGSCGSDYSYPFTITVNPLGSCVSVTSITNVPTTSTAGTSIYITGTVNPSNATNTNIAWNVSNDGGTGAYFSGNTLITPNQGIVTVTATISNGSCGSDYTYPFTITVNAPSGGCIPVSGIINVPTQSVAGSSINLSGTVEPSNATNTSITWNYNAGTTGATLSGTTLTTPNSGTVTVTATINNGLCGSNYTQSFYINVISGGGINPIPYIEPDYHDFSTINVGSSSAAQMFRLKNIGGGTFSVTGITQLNTDWTVTFDINEAKNISSTGNGYAFFITFAPKTAGNFSEEFKITTDFGETVKVLLQGTGVGGGGGVDIAEFTEDEINIYPNPSNGNVNIVVSEDANIKIIDVNGRILNSYKVNSNTKLEFRQAPGMYFVKIESKDKVSTRKLIVN